MTTNLIDSGLEDNLRECRKIFPNLKMVVIDTLQKIRSTMDAKYGADYQELSVLKSLADSLEIAVILVCHNRKAYDSNPNNLALETNEISGCADRLFSLLHNSIKILNAQKRYSLLLDSYFFENCRKMSKTVLIMKCIIQNLREKLLKQQN